MGPAPQESTQTGALIDFGDTSPAAAPGPPPAYQPPIAQPAASASLTQQLAGLGEGAIFSFSFLLKSFICVVMCAISFDLRIGEK